MPPPKKKKKGNNNNTNFTGWFGGFSETMNETSWHTVGS
jgi:hypothetical protein